MATAINVTAVKFDKFQFLERVLICWLGECVFFAVVSSNLVKHMGLQLCIASNPI